MSGSRTFFCLAVASLIGLASEQRPLQTITVPGGAPASSYVPVAFGSGAYGALLDCPGPQPTPVTDFEVRQIPHLDEPPARVPFRDPVFGTCVVRVTDRTADIAPGDTSNGLLNEYARVQTFNADESRIMVRGTEATWYV